MFQLARCYILTGFLLLFKFGVGRSDFQEDQEGILDLQELVEDLLEQMLQIVQTFYNKLKCFPDEVPDRILEIVRYTVNCVDHMERKINSALLSSKVHRTLIMNCFSFGEKQIVSFMQKINPIKGYCPYNMTDRTLQINVTSSFAKMFTVRISKGLVRLDRESLDYESEEFFGEDGEVMRRSPGGVVEKVVEHAVSVGEVTRPEDNVAQAL